MGKKTRQQLTFATPEKALLLLTLFLCAIGLLFVFEASVAEAFANFGNQFFFIRQQLIGLGVGLLALAVGIFLPSSFWKKISPFLYVASIALLISVFLPGIGREVKGAHRWISLGHFSLQPVE